MADTSNTTQTLSETPFPDTAEQLVADLDKAYPARCVSYGESLEAAHRYAGKRELIDELLSWLEETGGSSLAKSAVAARNK